MVINQHPIPMYISLMYISLSMLTSPLPLLILQSHFKKLQFKECKLRHVHVYSQPRLSSGSCIDYIDYKDVVNQPKLTS